MRVPRIARQARGPTRTGVGLLACLAAILRREPGQFQIVVQGTVLAVRRLSAMSFAHCDGKGVKLIEESGVFCGWIGGESIAGQFHQCLVASAIFLRRWLDELVPD